MASPTVIRVDGVLRTDGYRHLEDLSIGLGDRLVVIGRTWKTSRTVPPVVRSPSIFIYLLCKWLRSVVFPFILGMIYYVVDMVALACGIRREVYSEFCARTRGTLLKGLGGEQTKLTDRRLLLSILSEDPVKDAVLLYVWREG